MNLKQTLIVIVKDDPCEVTCMSVPTLRNHVLVALLVSGWDKMESLPPAGEYFFTARLNWRLQVITKLRGI
jgi:hypothetical protein